MSQIPLCTLQNWSKQTVQCTSFLFFFFWSLRDSLLSLNRRSWVLAESIFKSRFATFFWRFKRCSWRYSAIKFCCQQRPNFFIILTCSLIRLVVASLFSALFQNIKAAFAETRSLSLSLFSNSFLNRLYLWLQFPQPFDFICYCTALVFFIWCIRLVCIKFELLNFWFPLSLISFH